MKSNSIEQKDKYYKQKKKKNAPGKIKEKNPRNRKHFGKYK